MNAHIKDPKLGVGKERPLASTKGSPRWGVEKSLKRRNLKKGK